MGNSLAVRIPQAFVRDARLAEGDWLSFDLAADGRVPQSIRNEVLARLAPLFGY
jgi:antitoxin component of MazEF toxin-antitoxin module